MLIITRDIYRSSNGDRWRLVVDKSTGRSLVRHEPNLASGGPVTETDVDDFLSINGSGPEFEALRQMIKADTRNAESS